MRPFENKKGDKGNEDSTCDMGDPGAIKGANSGTCLALNFTVLFIVPIIELSMLVILTYHALLSHIYIQRPHTTK